MKKQISFSILSVFYLVAFVIMLSSCEVFRKTPEKSTSAYSGKRKTLTSRKPGPRSPEARTPEARTPEARTPGARTATRKPVPSTKKPSSVPSSSYGRPSTASPANIPEVVQVARTYAGTPYRSGGNDKNGIDCSGLICSVYSEIGVKVPRISWQQSEFGQEINRLEDIRAGDWLFFVPEAGREGYVSHAGIVTDVRNQQEIIFIHASTSRGVREDNLFSTYFKGRFVKAMRPF